MTEEGSLVVPIVLWGKVPPTHCISCMYLSRDQKTLVTGCYDGHICLWQVDPETLKMTPRCLMVGHTGAVMCLSRASDVLELDYIVSCSENGEMCTWDLVNGNCRENVKIAYIHTQMFAYVSTGSDKVSLFCSGYYPEVLVMDPFSLEILYTLSSRVNPDWISALQVLRPAKRKDDVVLAITTTGTVKVWSLFGKEQQTKEPIYENESKQIKCMNALAMTCCAYNHRTVLLVSSSSWQVYDAADFSLLCSVNAPEKERWVAGDFLSTDQVLIWTDEGHGYIYKLPSNKLKGKALSSSVAENHDFHTSSIESDQPYSFCTLSYPGEKPLSCPPTMKLVTATRQNKPVKYLIRGDSEGVIMIWTVPEMTAQQIADINKSGSVPIMPPSIITSLSAAWEAMKPPPVGILDQMDTGEPIKLTACIYLPQQSRLVVGREDGSIIIVPATQTVMLQLLHGNHQHYDDWPPHQVLIGHSGRVNCLLYPHSHSPRYDRTHLVSGSVDFAVCLWDLYTGNLIHRFCVHAGEITQLTITPDNCSPRIQKCICSVASDHSVTLLSLAERKCVVLASRHLFPVTTIKWRPLDDFMIVGCSDGAVYVWQMETGHLDRVLHGIIAEEVLFACSDNTIITGDATAGGELGLANPAVHFFRGLRHRNLSAIRHATQRGLHQLQQLHGGHGDHHDSQLKTKDYPLNIEGFRGNPKDPEGHILFFNVEALIVQLLSDEYGSMSPGSLEAQGLISASEYQKVAALTQSASPDAHKKIADFFGRVKDKAGDVEKLLKEKDRHGILAKMKEGAENVHTKLQAKAESVGLKPLNLDGKGEGWSNGDGSRNTLKRNGNFNEPNATMEIAQLLLSLLHAWGMDPDLDRVCESKLGLLRPMVPVSFGVICKSSYMSLLLPTWHQQLDLKIEPTQLEQRLPIELVRQDRLTKAFTARAHWELSTTLTSNHLLTVVALANTLMSMNNATFVPEQERNRKMHRPGNRAGVNWNKAEEENEEMYTVQQAQIKQGWSLLATLHCVLLPDKVAALGGVKTFKRPLVEMMACRWQDQCLELREAAQALLLAELGRLGPKGRKSLVDYWAQYLPKDPPKESAPQQQNHSHSPSSSSPVPNSDNKKNDAESNHEGNHADEICNSRRPNEAEIKTKEHTAIVLLGVIGAEFGQNVSTTTNQRRDTERRKSSVVEGFGIGNNNLARLTSMSLMRLLLDPRQFNQQTHSSLRRAAIDLIGRGFTVWEPYLDISKVLLGLLEMCCDADKLVPSMTYGLPLTPQADTCRTARHALTLIATARPAAFITTMAREVARFNAIQQNSQTLNVNVNSNILARAKPEILRIVEQLIDKMQSEMSDLLVEVMDIILHCLDPGHLKTKPLNEVFPAVCRFNQVSHCSASRRIAVGGRVGQLALYELRGTVKCQTVSAHQASVTALAFSPEGKFLVSYSCTENKLCFWQQTSSGMFGLGNSQTRCVKSYSTAPMNDVTRLNPMRLARLIWINNRTVTLMLADGSETRFNV